MALAALLLGACIPYPGELPPDDSGRTVITEGVFAELDAGAAQLDSLHFTVRAYNSEKARALADTAEAAYNRVMLDTGLYSFKPRGLYKLVLYANDDEYRRKTGQPSWSGGVSVGNAIYAYEGARLQRLLSHEMTHLVFYEYMGRANPDHRWINEGLAVYEENKAMGPGQLGQTDIFAAVRGSMRQQPLPMDQMTHLVPATEKDYTVSLWYAQSESMVRFLIERGGRMGFAQFLAGLRDDKKLDQAVSESFVGIWTDMASFHGAWLRSQQ